MKLGFVAYKNMISKPLNMVLSLMLLVLSVSLVTFVLQLSKQLNVQMDKNITPVDMVVGAKGSPLQLVLSSVLHIDNPTGNIKLQEAEQIIKHPFVDSAIPVSYGDNYKGYRIMGTEPEYLDRYEAVLQEGRLYNTTFEVVVGSAVVKRTGLKLGDKVVGNHGLAAGGGEAHDDHPYTVVGILKPSGTVVDNLLICNLKSVWDAHDHDHEGEGHDEGDAHDHDHEDGEHHHDDDHDHDHGDEEHDHDHKDGDHAHNHEDEAHDHDDDHEHHHGDEGHDHDHGDGEHDHDHEDEAHNHDDDHGHHHGDEGHDHDHGDGEHDHDHEGEAHNHDDDHDHDHAHDDEDKEITSLLVKFKSPLGLVQLPRFINENTNMQAALPGFEIQRLMGLLGSGVKTLNGIAIAILLVSGFSIFISLLKTIRERRQELALLRTYGLGTRKLLYLVLFEGHFLAFIGFVLGWLLGRLALILASKYIEEGYGYSLSINGPDFVELILLGVTLLIAIIAVFLASTSIFKLNISKVLSDA